MTAAEHTLDQNQRHARIHNHYDAHLEVHKLLGLDAAEDHTALVCALVEAVLPIGALDSTSGALLRQMLETLTCSARTP